MGLISNILGIRDATQGVGTAVENVAEVFTVNKTKAELAARAQAMAALKQYEVEFSRGGTGWYNSFINGLNRLPRPIMALGTVGLFVFAMVNPTHFATRMQGLAFVPDPLWWLLGAVVSFYFGARELHYSRGVRQNPDVSNVVQLPQRTTVTPVAASNETAFPDNAALSEWAATSRLAA